MGDQWSDFEPTMPHGLYMPEGYGIAGISYRDDGGRQRVAYYWFIPCDGDGEDAHVECGPNVSTKQAARRGALEHLNGPPDPRQKKLKLRGGR